jgi:hypothetical protein
VRSLKKPARVLALAAVAGAGCLCAIGASPSGPASADASPSGPTSAGASSSGPTSASSPAAGIGIYSLGGHLAEVADPSVYSKVIGDAADADTLAGMPGRSLAYFASADVNVNWSTGVP